MISSTMENDTERWRTELAGYENADRCLLTLSSITDPPVPDCASPLPISPQWTRQRTTSSLVVARRTVCAATNMTKRTPIGIFSQPVCGFECVELATLGEKLTNAAARQR